MDNTTKNKVIAAFMGVIWYDSYGECREVQTKLINEATNEGSSFGKLDQIMADIKEKHQFCPEYHNSYDRMIPVVKKLRRAILDAFGLCEFYRSFDTAGDTYIWLENKHTLFNCIYETILQFNQLTKNKANGEATISNDHP